MENPLTEKLSSGIVKSTLASLNKGVRVFNILKPTSFRDLKEKLSSTCQRIWDRVGFVAGLKGVIKTPCFYYSVISLIMLSLIYLGATHQKDIFGAKPSTEAALAKAIENVRDGDLFLSQVNLPFLEPPELRIIQNDSLSAITTPRVLSTKVLGAIFGQGPQARKEIVEYEVQSGDTYKSIANKFDISLNTLLWANDLTSSSKVKTGQSLVILPVSGTVHIVSSGDTISSIAKVYKATAEEIIDVNELLDESDVYVGDILVVPNGTMPKKAPVVSQTYLASNYFIFPVAGRITQILHWYNGVDIGNKCGTPIFAAAPGTILKAKYGWNGGGGNVVTIQHKNGVISYYGHLMSINVKEGDVVDVGDRIGLMGGGLGMEGAGISTGCHLHFTIIGAKNPFGTLKLGYQMNYIGE